MVRSLRAVTTVLAALAVTLGVGATASAAPGPGDPGIRPTASAPGPTDLGVSVPVHPAAGDVSPDMRAALRRDLKLTDKQVRDRLIRADWAARLDPLLRDRLGPAFGGSWLAADGHEYVVAITDRRLEGVVRASGATPRLVARSERALIAIGDRLGARAAKRKDVPKKMAGWVIDPQTNQVRVQFEPGGRGAAEAFVRAAGLKTSEVSYEAVPNRPTTTRDVEAGDQYLPGHYVSGVPVNTSRCSAGFAVTFRNPFIPNPPPVRGYLTAAHCFDNVAFDLQGPIPHLVREGVFSLAVLEAEHDEAVVSTDAGFRPVPRVNGYGSKDIAVTDGTVQLDGSPVCHSGAATGLVCGKIRDGWYNPILNGITQKLNMKATDTCAQRGDSGGPIISGTHAQGVEFAIRLVPCFPLIEHFTYYVPLGRALSTLNSTLLKAPAVSTPSPTTPSAKWTEGGQFWDGLGGAIKGRVASVSLNQDHVQIFGRGTDDRLYTNISTNGVWGGWQGLGDALTEPPAVLARAGGAIEVFYRGLDTRPYVRRWNGAAWEAPVKLGDIDVEGPIQAVSLYGGAHAALFIRSSDDHVYFAGHNGTKWSNWVDLGGDVNAAPTAIARPNGAGVEVLEVYARWADDTVRYRRADPSQPGFQPWVSLGGIFREAAPVGVTVGVDHSFLVGIASDHTLHIQQWRNGDWLRGADGRITTGWRGVGGSVYSQPSAIAGPGEQVRVFARDINQQINMIAWRGGDIRNWERWVGVGGDTGVPVGVNRRTTDGPIDVIDAFGVDATTLQPFYTTVDAGSQVAQVAVNETAAQVGDPAFYTVSGPPGAPVSWSSTQDGVTVEDHAFYGQYLDGDGQLTVAAAEWQGSAMGTWVKQVHVGSETVQAAQVDFTVAPRPVAVYVDRGQYQVGENITYVVTGPPNKQVRWTSWVNGQPSGESDASYNQYTDANGVLTLTTPWTDTRTGTWIKQVSVGGATAQTTFEVTAPTPPPPPPPAPPPVRAGPMTAATGTDGRTYLFALREDRRLVAREQQAGGGWSDWYPVGDFVFDLLPTAVVNAQGRVEVYAVGTDHAVYRNVSTGAGAGAWSGWGFVNSCCIVSTVSATLDRFGRMNVVGLGTDNGVYITREVTPGSNSWTGWGGLGGYLTSAPVAVRDLNDQIVVFAAGGDRNVYYNRLIDVGAEDRQIGGWGGLGGGPVVGELTAAAPSATVFVRRPDNLVYATHMNGGSWRPWTSVGDGALTTDPVGVGGTGMPTVFALGTDQQVYADRTTCFGGGWICFETTYSGWHLTGAGSFAGSPAATRLPDGRVRLLALTPDRQVYVNTQLAVDTMSFSGWSAM